MIVNNIQKSIYDCLKSQNSENFKRLTGIFNYIDKNTDFPYIFFSMKDVNDISTYSKKIYSCTVSINIFDKSTTGSFVASLMDEIKEIFSNISNFSLDNHKILDIKPSSFKTSLENNNTIWKNEIDLEILIEKVKK